MTKTPNQLELLRSKRKKKEEPVVVDNSPLQRCIDCINWQSKGEPAHSEFADNSYGRCKKNGFGCPPMHTCNGWEDEAGNTKQRPADKPFYL